MKVCTEIDRAEQARQADWVDKNLLHVPKPMPADTWEKFKEYTRKPKAVWELH